MSAMIAVAPQSSSFQPFQCHVCQRRFTRHENLKRHAALHSRSAGQGSSFNCEFCPLSFSRRDLRHRHVKRKHPEQDATNTTSKLHQQNRDARRGGDRAQPASIPPVEAGADRQPQDSAYQTSQDVFTWPLDSSWMQQPPDRSREQDVLFDMASLTGSTTAKRAEAYSCDFTDHSIRPPTSPSTRFADPFKRHATDEEQVVASYEQSIPFEPPNLLSDYHFPSPEATSIRTPGSVNASPSDAGSINTVHIPDGLSSRDLPYIQDDWFPSASQVQRGYQLYFSHISHFVPFLHRAIFDATETAPHLGLSMLCLAYQHGEDPDCSGEMGSGKALSQRCYHRARVLAASEEERADDLPQYLSLAQAYWMLEVCAMMYFCGEFSGQGLKLHSRMISLSRSGGLTQAIPVGSAMSDDLESLWRVFIRAESHKRTILAVHQIDALWYQLFSIPRSLSHLEIKHDLPCRETCWIASSSAQWAHRQLTVGQSAASSVLYSDAIRRVLSPTLEMDSLPAFDLYGAINIAQFLLSSIREVSGWSTMTGRISLDRFEALQTSLLALESLIRPSAASQNALSAHTVLCEATWEMAMIELRIWSPSHTGGIIGGSVDAFLTESTTLALSCGSLCDVATADAIQPHIDWYLRYLDASGGTPDLGPPWMTLYAFKAFLIAWQLVRGGSPGAMRVVGVDDAYGAVTWARKVFCRSEARQQISTLIGSCLDMLC